MMESLWDIMYSQVEGISVVTLIISMIVSGILVHIAYYLHSYVRGYSRSVRTEVLYILMCIYVCFLINITLLTREQGSREGIVLIPFANLFGATGRLNYRMLAYALYNVVLFVPYGMLLNFLKKHLNLWRRVCIVMAECFLASLTIEGLQLISGCGYFEVEDLVCNVLGGALGVILAIPFKRLFASDI